MAIIYCGLKPGIYDTAPEFVFTDLKRAASPAVFCLAAFPCLQLFEMGQNIIPTPAGIAKLTPVIKILRLAAHV